MASRDGLRPVVFKMWIPPKWDNGTSVSLIPVYGKEKIEGTGEYTDMTIPGFFHCMGYSTNEIGNPHSVAIVEDKEGLLHEVELRNIRFLDRG